MLPYGPGPKPAEPFTGPGAPSLLQMIVPAPRRASSAWSSIAAAHPRACASRSVAASIVALFPFPKSREGILNSRKGTKLPLGPHVEPMISASTSSPSVRNDGCQRVCSSQQGGGVLWRTRKAVTPGLVVAVGPTRREVVDHVVRFARVADNTARGPTAGGRDRREVRLQGDREELAFSTQHVRRALEQHGGSCTSRSVADNRLSRRNWDTAYR